MHCMLTKETGASLNEQQALGPGLNIALVILVGGRGGWEA